MLRNMFDIMGLYLRITYSSRATLIFQIAMPLLFTFLIGQATGGFGGGDSSLSARWPLVVVNEDRGELGALLVTRLEQQAVLDVQTNRAAGAIAAVEEGPAVAALLIAPDFSHSLLHGEGTDVSFYVDPEQVRLVQPVEAAVVAVLTEMNSAVAASTLSAAALDELSLADNGEARLANREAGIRQASALWQSPPVIVTLNEDEVEALTSVIPQGINQSSPGMMAMFVTFGITGGAAVLIEERRWGTLRRLAVMPVKRGAIIGGKLLGIVAAGILQMMILIAAGALLFDVAWGNAPLALLLMVVSFALAISGLGLLIAAWAQTISQANALGTILVLSLAALGGAWWPLAIVPAWMQVVGRFSPLFWAMQGFHDIITRGLGVPAVLPEVLVLLGFSVVFLGIGVWRFRVE